MTGSRAARSTTLRIDAQGPPETVNLRQPRREFPMTRIDTAAARQIADKCVEKARTQSASPETESAPRRLADGIISGKKGGAYAGTCPRSTLPACRKSRISPKSASAPRNCSGPCTATTAAQSLVSNLSSATCSYGNRRTSFCECLVELSDARVETQAR